MRPDVYGNPWAPRQKSLRENKNVLSYTFIQNKSCCFLSVLFLNFYKQKTNNIKLEMPGSDSFLSGHI